MAATTQPRPATKPVPGRAVRHRSSPRERMPAAERVVRAANLAATREPQVAGYIDAGQIFPFAEGALYAVYAAPERVTDVALQPGETLISVAAGDTARWLIGDTTSGDKEARRTHILIKPVAAGLATNVVIATDRRTYHLALTSTAATAMTALAWTYPEDALIAVKRTPDQPVVSSSPPPVPGIAPDRLEFGYSLSGARPAWRPLRVFDDGRQTYIEFPPGLAVGEAPPLFLVDPNGVAQLVNYRLIGRYYVVDRLFDRAELRLGLKHQIVVRITRVASNTRAKQSS
nr:P-type conjugative transfer protein TrbG [Sphingomonas sp.]